MQLVSVTRTSLPTAATAHLIAMPPTVATGDLLVVLLATRAVLATTPSGWTLELSQTNTNAAGATYTKRATGAEGGTSVDFVTASAVSAAAHVYQVRGDGGSAIFTNTQNGTSTTPNSDPLTSPLGAHDILWLSWFSVHSDPTNTVSAYPTDFTDGIYDDAGSGGAGGITIGSARRELNAASLNPDPFTISVSKQWVAMTVGIVEPVVRAIAAGADDGLITQPSTFDATGTTSAVGNTTTDRDSFFRFLNVTIPPGSVIVSAALTVEATGLVGTATNILTKVFAEAADNPLAPTTAAEFNGRTRTTASVDWDPSAWVTTTKYTSPDLAAVIQEVVDRGGWWSGNALQLFWVDDGTPTSNRLVFATFENAVQEPRLVIEYLPPEETFFGAVTATADDGYSFTSTFDIANGSWFGKVSAASIDGFVRFQNVTIPQGATILTAVLKVRASDLSSTTTGLHGKVRANAIDDAIAPTSAATHDALARTTAGVDWDPTAWVLGTQYSPPDLSAVIQEIVNRGGWASGNDLMLLVDDDGSTDNIRAAMADLAHATYAEPRLVITYSTIVTGGAVATINVSAEGSGIVYAEGGAEAGISVAASGAGIEVFEGGAEAAILVIADGDGVVIEYAEEGSEAAIEVIADGGGANVLYAEEGSEAVINVGATGGGAQIIEGGAVATINVSAAGAGTQMGPAMIIEKGSWLSYRKLN